VIAAGGRRCAVRPIATSEYPTPAARPANSVLVSERGAPRLPGWADGLSAFMAELAQVAA
jgi:dTDP-4-dehydrorhamnose reductase